ncbi:MAG TPA: SDR family NAD(P)-dependent oxidoreductase [Caulobacteraceae bacterium]|nr:SDR family NAD(P)-dependent oxidoreductase [Caulobacteraceae bacterium]
MAQHPAIAPGRAAVITGAASGIGLAAAKRFAALGMKVVLADLEGEQLDQAAAEVIAEAKGGASDVCTVPTDVRRLEEVMRLKEEAFDAFGGVAVLMNNAGIGGGLGKPWESYDRWRQILEVNLWGVVHGVHAFVPALIDQAAPSAIINTGSKQGITNPPGGTAYNVAKSGLKTLTEQLSFALGAEAPQISVHLLVPGFTYTGIGGRQGGPEDKPPGAWTSEQVADVMLERLAAGDFYILCPDNMVTREVDNRRMAWAMGDLIENRPALSRWRPEFKDAFDAFMSKTN